MFEYTIIEHFYNTGELNMHTYFYGDVIHRVYGPAQIIWFPYGPVQHEIWYRAGEVHCATGPAYQEWHDDGTIRHAAFYLFQVDIDNNIKEWANAFGIADLFQMSPEQETIFKLTWK